MSSNVSANLKTVIRVIIFRKPAVKITTLFPPNISYSNGYFNPGKSPQFAYKKKFIYVNTKVKRKLLNLKRNPDIYWDLNELFIASIFSMRRKEVRISPVWTWAQ